jgi:hypothetical protein
MQSAQTEKTWKLQEDDILPGLAQNSSIGAGMAICKYGTAPAAAQPEYSMNFFESEPAVRTRTMPSL